MEVFFSIKNASPEWDILMTGKNVFLSRPFLEAVEENPPKGMRFVYILLYKNNLPCGVALGQIQHFNAEESIPVEEKEKCFFTVVSNNLKQWFSKKVNFNTLVLGNLMLTGEHGSWFDERLVNEKEAEESLGKALKVLPKLLAKKGDPISVTLLKDYFYKRENFVNESFKEFRIQPNMILKRRPEWESFDDYLGAMLSKYRVRVRRAFKKGTPLEYREMTLEDIRTNQERIHELYLKIAKNAGFNVLQLNPDYYAGLKEKLGDKFCLHGVYHEEELVAFYTTIHNGEELEAHFLGFDEGKNREFQIYLNILYNIIKKGISLKVDQIVFARTAMEIKSSVGAVAHEMYCYFRHNAAIANQLVTPIFNYLNPSEDWVPRHPFKKAD